MTEAVTLLRVSAKGQWRERKDILFEKSPSSLRLASPDKGGKSYVK